VPTAAHFAWGDDRTAVRMLGGRGSTTAGRKLGLISQRSRQPEAREEAFVAEPGDGGDPLALESQHEHGVGARGRRLRVGEVATEGRLGVGPGGQEPERPATEIFPVAKEGADRVLSLVLERHRRHREKGVVAEEGDHLVDIAALYGVSQAAIMADNNISNPNLVYAGTDLTIRNPTK